MDIANFMSSGLYTWVVIPLLIFLARICDVSLGTIRVILISKGIKYIPPIFGFFEILIWLLAIGQIMTNLTNPLCYIAYAGGFAMGTHVGMLLEGKLSIGTVIVRIITKRDTSRMIETLKAAKYGVTVLEGQGISGPVKIILTVVKKKDLSKVVDTIKRFHPTAFYSVEDVRFVTQKTKPSAMDYYNELKKEII